MMRARTEFSLKNADDIFNPKIETKNKKRSQKRKEIDNGQIYEVLCVCVCAVLKVGELLMKYLICIHTIHIPEKRVSCDRIVEAY